MFGISRKEIYHRMKEKLIQELVSGRRMHLDGIGTLQWKYDDTVRFSADKEFMDELHRKERARNSGGDYV